MKTVNFRTVYLLSWIAALSAAIASVAGLFIKNFYTDNEFVQTAWYGNDWVTLLVVVPSLLILLLFSNKNTVRIQLIWMGLLGYLVYNYAFYLFGSAYNAGFIFYIIIFSSSLFAIILGLSSIHTFEISINSKILRWISGYLFLISIMLCLVEVPPIISHILSGKIPDIVVKTNHPTSVVYALDLTLVVPLMILAAILLWKNKAWGYILSAIMLIKGFTYGLVLTAGTILLAQNNIDDPLLPVWIFITVGGLAGSILLLKKLPHPENK